VAVDQEALADRVVVRCLQVAEPLAGIQAPPGQLPELVATAL
jgi:hypothetical protein